MKPRIGSTFLLSLGLLLQDCTLTSHPLESQPAPGKASSSAEMERMFSQPGIVQLETVKGAEWAVALSGGLNLKSPEAIKAGLQDRDEPIQIYAYVLTHPTRGNFIVDTGVSAKVLAQPSEYGLNWLLQYVLHLDKLRINKSTS